MLYLTFSPHFITIPPKESSQIGSCVDEMVSEQPRYRYHRKIDRLVSILEICLRRAESGFLWETNWRMPGIREPGPNVISTLLFAAYKIQKWFWRGGGFWGLDIFQNSLLITGIQGKYQLKYWNAWILLPILSAFSFQLIFLFTEKRNCWKM